MSAVGGKAAGLARLAALGLPVPRALVLTADVHARARGHGRLSEDDRATLAEALERLGTPLAVRSSAVDEDAADRSAAGQYESVMGVVDLDGLVAAVERCYAAAGSARVRAYRGDEPADVAVVLQREVAASRAAVGFSIDPVSGERSHVVLEVVFGHGEALVSGLEQPDRYRVPRDGGPVRVRIAEKTSAADGRGGARPLAAERRTARTLRDDEARAAALVIRDAERGFGQPVDVELCFEGSRIWAVQCRAVTAHG